VTDVVPFQGWSVRELLQAVASVESMSEHPIARAIVEKATADGLEVEFPDSLTAYPGKGVEAIYRGERWFIGKPRVFRSLAEKKGIMETVERLEAEGKTVVLAERDGEMVGCVALRDQIRPEALQMIKQLKQLGIQIAMLTGDQTKTAEAIAKEAGIDLVFADLLPEQKVERVETLNDTYGQVAMVGDGVNDAPAIARAQIGIAMGGAGTDIALETADVILMNDDLMKIPYMIRLSKKLDRIIKQNIVFALTVIVLLVLTNLAKLVNLPLGVVGHEGSTILVILNGLRLLR
jgi:Cd2+/Zn2+-exporting ATPase